MTTFDSLLDRFGRWLAQRLRREAPGEEPFVPAAPWLRRMIALGSGDPTRTICSPVIAEAFGRVQCPTLPRVERVTGEAPGISRFRRQEILHIRHYSLYAPADFDLSPYFAIVKPTL